MFSFNQSFTNPSQSGAKAASGAKNQKNLEDVSFTVVGMLTSPVSGVEYLFGAAKEDSSSNLYVWPKGMVELFFKVKDLPKLMSMTSDVYVKKFLNSMIKYGEKIERRLAKDKATDILAESLIEILEISQSLAEAKTEDGKKYIEGLMAEKIETCNVAINKWNDCIPKPIKNITTEDVKNVQKLEEFVYDQFSV